MPLTEQEKIEILRNSIIIAFSYPHNKTPLRAKDITITKKIDEYIVNVKSNSPNNIPKFIQNGYDASVGKFKLIID